MWKASEPSEGFALMPAGRKAKKWIPGVCIGDQEIVEVIKYNHGKNSDFQVKCGVCGTKYKMSHSNAFYRIKHKPDSKGCSFCEAKPVERHPAFFQHKTRAPQTPMVPRDQRKRCQVCEDLAHRRKAPACRGCNLPPGEDTPIKRGPSISSSLGGACAATLR
jgi:hypothetical protein